MRYVYPYEMEKEGNATIVHFPDVPGALTQVEADEDPGQMARDCLLAALGGYIELRHRPPKPSPCRGRPRVTLDILSSVKLALATELIDASMSNSSFARELEVSEKVVRRWLDLDHFSRIDRLESALGYFGKRVELAVRSEIQPGRLDHTLAV